MPLAGAKQRGAHMPHLPASSSSVLPTLSAAPALPSPVASNNTANEAAHALIKHVDVMVARFASPWLLTHDVHERLAVMHARLNAWTARDSVTSDDGLGTVQRPTAFNDAEVVERAEQAVNFVIMAAHLLSSARAQLPSLDSSPSLSRVTSDATPPAPRNVLAYEEREGVDVASATSSATPGQWMPLVSPSAAHLLGGASRSQDAGGGASTLATALTTSMDSPLFDGPTMRASVARRRDAFDAHRPAARGGKSTGALAAWGAPHSNSELLRTASGLQTTNTGAPLLAPPRTGSITAAPQGAAEATDTVVRDTPPRNEAPDVLTTADMASLRRTRSYFAQTADMQRLRRDLSAMPQVFSMQAAGKNWNDANLSALGKDAALHVKLIQRLIDSMGQRIWRNYNAVSTLCAERGRIVPTAMELFTLGRFQYTAPQRRERTPPRTQGETAPAASDARAQVQSVSVVYPAPSRPERSSLVTSCTPAASGEHPVLQTTAEAQRVSNNVAAPASRQSPTIRGHSEPVATEDRAASKAERASTSPARSEAHAQQVASCHDTAGQVSTLDMPPSEPDGECKAAAGAVASAATSLISNDAAGGASRSLDAGDSERRGHRPQLSVRVGIAEAASTAGGASSDSGISEEPMRVLAASSSTSISSTALRRRRASASSINLPATLTATSATGDGGGTASARGGAASGALRASFLAEQAGRVNSQHTLLPRAGAAALVPAARKYTHGRLTERSLHAANGVMPSTSLGSRIITGACVRQLRTSKWTAGQVFSPEQQVMPYGHLIYISAADDIYHTTSSVSVSHVLVPARMWHTTVQRCWRLAAQATMHRRRLIYLLLSQRADNDFKIQRTILELYSRMRAPRMVADTCAQVIRAVGPSSRKLFFDRLSEDMKTHSLLESSSELRSELALRQAARAMCGCSSLREGLSAIVAERIALRKAREAERFGERAARERAAVQRLEQELLAAAGTPTVGMGDRRGSRNSFSSTQDNRMDGLAPAEGGLGPAGTQQPSGMEAVGIVSPTATRSRRSPAGLTVLVGGSEASPLPQPVSGSAAAVQKSDGAASEPLRVEGSDGAVDAPSVPRRPAPPPTSPRAAATAFAAARHRSARNLVALTPRALQAQAQAQRVGGVSSSGGAVAATSAGAASPVTPAAASPKNVSSPTRARGASFSRQPAPSLRERGRSLADSEHAAFLRQLDAMLESGERGFDEWNERHKDLLRPVLVSAADIEREAAGLNDSSMVRELLLLHGEWQTAVTALELERLRFLAAERYIHRLRTQLAVLSGGVSDCSGQDGA